MKSQTAKATLSPSTILLLACCLGAAPFPPEGSFRLTVEEVVQSEYCRVTKFRIQARPKAQMVALRCEDGAQGRIGLSSAPKGKWREGTVTLATMLCESNSACHMLTLLESSPGGSSASGWRSYELAPEAKLASVSSITVTNGVYKLDHPLVIGQCHGQAMQLVVGSWNWEQTSQKK